MKVNIDIASNYKRMHLLTIDDEKGNSITVSLMGNDHSRLEDFIAKYGN